MAEKQSASKKGVPKPGERKRARFVCAWCGKEWSDKSYTVGRKKFCSTGCRSSHTVARMATISPTSIEAETYLALDQLGIEYRRQCRVGRFAVDAYIPASRTVVEVMGDYFHANPAVYPVPQPGMQAVNWARDQKKAATLRVRGYRLIL